MSDLAVSREERDPLALAALACGLAGLLAFIVASFTSDVLWPDGLVLAAAGAILGIVVLRRSAPGTRNRTMALAGVIASALVIAAFLVWLITGAD